jgi:arylsulfatase A-like enzyme
MHRRDFLKTISVGAASLTLPGCRTTSILSGSKASARKPSVILVMTDDQGYGDLACHGNKMIKTPHLDKLHAQSIRLADFHVCPTCAPTRAALMTGHYSIRTGIWHTIMGRSIMRRDEVTMGNVFADSGYKTGIFGKWHLGDNYPYRPQDRGFHEVLIHGGGGVGQTPDYWGNDYFDDTYFHNGKPEKFSGYCTDVWFNESMKFIESNKNRPFFCYLPTNAPHGPFNVAKKYSSLYKDNEKVFNADFYGMITNIDENMGRLLDKLKELEIDNNTIFIFMTDNGSSAGFGKGKGYNADMRGKKGTVYDGGHRVPCFIRWPAGKLNGPRDINILTAHIDLLPTLIDMCGLEQPDGVSFDGASLVPLLTESSKNWTDRTIVVDQQRIEHPQKWRNSAVMTQRWRLINGQELYDMQADPSQKNNIADRHRDVVEKLRQAYERWWADVSQRFDEYSEIVLGSDKENPARLTCHDWHTGEGYPPWSQHSVLNAYGDNGFWAVEVSRAGAYEFELRRWPREVDKPITAAIPNGKAISATQARLKIGDIDLKQEIPSNARAVTFKTTLPAGKTRLQTWFTDDQGASCGAYFVYVKYLA